MPRNIYPRISQETSTPAEIQAVTGRWSITDTPAIASPVTGAGLVEAQRCQYLPPALPGVSMMMAELDAGEALQMLMEGVTGHLDLAVQAAVILLKLKAVCDMAVAEDCCEVEVEGELRTGDNEDNTEDENMAIQGTGHGEEVTRKFDMLVVVAEKILPELDPEGSQVRARQKVSLGGRWKVLCRGSLSVWEWG